LAPFDAKQHTQTPLVECIGCVIISPWSYSSPREITPSQKVSGVRLSATFQNIHCLVGWLGSGVRVRASFLIFSRGGGDCRGRRNIS